MCEPHHRLWGGSAMQSYPAGCKNSQSRQSPRFWNHQTLDKKEFMSQRLDPTSTPRERLKSKRRRSAPTLEPCCDTSGPSTCFSAACSRCVAVWWACILLRRLLSISAVTCTRPSYSQQTVIWHRGDEPKEIGTRDACRYRLVGK